MAFTGGDIIEITFNHPTIGTGRFSPKSGEDSTFDLGGFRSADDANMVTGNGETIRQLNRVRWSAEFTVANDDIVRLDAQKAVQLAANPVEAVWTIACVNGQNYKGKGSPVGDIQPNMNAATFTLKISGGGTLELI